MCVCVWELPHSSARTIASFIVPPVSNTGPNNSALKEISLVESSKQGNETEIVTKAKTFLATRRLDFQNFK